MRLYTGRYQPQLFKPGKPSLAVGLIALIIPPLVARNVFRWRMQGVVRGRKREIGKEWPLVLLAVWQELNQLIREVVR